MEKYIDWGGWTIKDLRRGEHNLFDFDFAETRTGVIKKFEELMGKGEWRRYRCKGWLKIVRVKFVEADKMERKKTVLLNLIDDWEKLCKKSLSKLSVKRNPHTCGFISGELKAIVIMRKFIDEAWRQ